MSTEKKAACEYGRCHVDFFIVVQFYVNAKQFVF